MLCSVDPQLSVAWLTVVKMLNNVSHGLIPLQMFHSHVERQNQPVYQRFNSACGPQALLLCLLSHVSLDKARKLACMILGMSKISALTKKYTWD